MYFCLMKPNSGCSKSHYLSSINVLLTVVPILNRDGLFCFKKEPFFIHVCGLAAWGWLGSFMKILFIVFRQPLFSCPSLSYLIISLMRDWVRSLAPSGPHLSSMSSIGIELKTMAVINLKINELNIQETAIITLENVSPKWILCHIQFSLFSEESTVTIKI